MLKFRNKLDAQTFLVEIQNFENLEKVDENYQPTKEELKGFIKSRSSLSAKLKNSKKSSAQKANWRENRTKMMKGIKAFHRSVQGKRFHKRLGRFLATRIFRPKRKNEENSSEYDELLVKQSYLKGLNAAKQHLFVEMEYFHQLEEQVDLEIFITDYAIPVFRKIECAILEDRELTEDEYTFLFDILEKDVLLGSLASAKGVEFAEIKNLWNSITEKLQSDGFSESDGEYYTKVLEELQNRQS